MSGARFKARLIVNRILTSLFDAYDVTAGNVVCNCIVSKIAYRNKFETKKDIDLFILLLIFSDT